MAHGLRVTSGAVTATLSVAACQDKVGNCQINPELLQRQALYLFASDGLDVCEPLRHGANALMIANQIADQWGNATTAIRNSVMQQPVMSKPE